MINSASIRFSVSVFLLAVWTSSDVHAHGTKHGRYDATGSYPVEQRPFGIAGHPKKLTRTIIMDMDDTMRFSPSQVRVKQGDTIRFVLRNKGKLKHEWVLGTDKELKEHAELMRKHPDMKHKEVHMVHVKPGESEEVIWHFNRASTVSVGCGFHWQAGMIGEVKVVPVGTGAPEVDTRLEKRR